MYSCTNSCGITCETVFDYIYIWPLTSVTQEKIEWQLKPTFLDPGPYTFQLQIGYTSSTDDNNWTDFLTPVVDTYFITFSRIDRTGKFLNVHFRLKLTTGVDTYYSAPISTAGALIGIDANRAKEITRLESLNLKQITGIKGFLLKRKIFGTPCSCRDRMTQEITKPDHLDCYGTGILGGYYEPESCYYIAQSNKANYEKLDNTLGSINNMPVISGRCVNNPQVFCNDIWIENATDNRWRIEKIKNIVEIQGVPIILNVQLRLLPFSHIIYKYPITTDYTL